MAQNYLTVTASSSESGNENLNQGCSEKISFFLVLIMMVNSILYLVQNIYYYFNWDTLIKLLFKPFMVLAFIPYFYALAIYIHIEKIFTRINLFKNLDKKSVKYLKSYILIFFFFRLKRLEKFPTEKLNYIFKINKKQEVKQFVKEMLYSTK